MPRGDPDTFRVGPALTNLPMVAAPPVENAGPQQLAQMGQAVTKAGGVAGAIFEDVLKEQNATRVTEGLTALTERRNELNIAALSELGKNALERPSGKSLDEEFGEEFDNTIENIERGLGNNAQRKMFRENAQRMSLELRGRVQAHVAEQGKVYRVDVNKGLISTGQRQLALATDDGLRDEARGLITRATDDLVALGGLSKDSRDEALREALTPGHVAQLDRLLAEDKLDAAAEYLSRYRSDLTVDVDTKVTAVIAEQQSLVLADLVGTQTFDTVFGSGAASAVPRTSDLVPVAKGGTIIQQIFGNKARITSTYRPPDHALSRANPNSWHTKSKAAVDMKPIPGMTFEQAKAQIEGQGYHLIEAKNEVGSGRSRHATGDHWHFVLGSKDGKNPTPSVSTASGSLEDAYRSIDEREDLTPKQKARAKDTVRELRQARDYDRKERDDSLISSAYAEADKGGGVSNATISRLTAAGLGSAIPGLRSFERATQERAAGKLVSDDDGLDTYGALLRTIADGDLDGPAALERNKPYLSDSQYRKLQEAFTKSPRDTTARVAALVKELDVTSRYSGVFEDEDGKFDKKKYNRYVGAVENTIREREERSGKLVDKDERRQIVLGLLAEAKVEGGGRQFDVRVLYDNIPLRARQNIMSGLRRGGNNKPQISDVVRVWRGLRPGVKATYE